ncbi:MAG: FAD-binding oxidoreductase, partial [Geminicoccaceae bacterium]|nr:FAD-binding oxidoreductase [Geminicoccaceae bacterium]
GAAVLGERLLGLSARRSLPRFSPPFLPPMTGRRSEGPEVLLFVDTFNRHFEPENARAAVRVLEAAGYAIRYPDPPGDRPLCCGRTFLAAGLIDQARTEARRTVEALAPMVERGVPVVGLEPSCLLTMRDELEALLPGGIGALAEVAKLFAEFVVEERAAGRFQIDLAPLGGEALVHGHCHEKAFGAFGPVLETLRLIPGLEPTAIDSSCCGMAGAFGYDAEHYDVSMTMAELSLLPAVRSAPSEALLVADGTSCRHQIRDGSGRDAVHLVRLLDRALAA